jgi:hypothetical protein
MRPWIEKGASRAGRRRKRRTARGSRTASPSLGPANSAPSPRSPGGPRNSRTDCRSPTSAGRPRSARCSGSSMRRARGAQPDGIVREERRPRHRRCGTPCLRPCAHPPFLIVVFAALPLRGRGRRSRFVRIRGRERGFRLPVSTGGGATTTGGWRGARATGGTASSGGPVTIAAAGTYPKRSRQEA